MRFLLSLTLAAVLAAPATARVVSYAPVTDQFATPVQQPRTSARFVLVESASASGWMLGAGPSDAYLPWIQGAWGHLVVRDATGASEARVVLPTGGADAWFTAVAARPGPDGKLRILAVTTADPAGSAPVSVPRLLFSRDGGESFAVLDLPVGTVSTVLTNGSFGWSGMDFGGPFVRGRNPSLRLGTDASPFTLLLGSSGRSGGGALVVVDDGGKVRTLAETAPPDPDGSGGARLVGASRDGSAVLVIGRAQPPGAAGPAVPAHALWRVRLAGGVEKLLDIAGAWFSAEGWDTPSGATYLEVSIPPGSPVPAPFRSSRALYLVDGGLAKEVASSSVSTSDWNLHLVGLFAIPTAGFDGAWIVSRGPGHPTVLAAHSAATGLIQKWSDPTAPEVEALHAGASGRRLLVQVHRPRPQMDQRLFKDPALAIWEDGSPAPARYDELFLNEQSTKGFVYLDVEEAAGGAPFVFDSGGSFGCPACAGGPAGDAGAGGADVVQEWGVVKASLRQRLVIPAVARVPGAGGAFWKSDLLLRNPGSEALRVFVRFVPAGPSEPREAVVTLEPREMRLVPDLLAALFGIEKASGALFLTPEGTGVVSATTRTYTAAPVGSYGMSMAAVDLLASSSAGFPLSFAGALPGAGHRTNVGAIDVAGRGASVGLRVASESGWTGRTDVSMEATPGGTVQLDRLGDWLGVESWRTGALEFAPSRGEVVPFVASIDETTNDPTYWRPDLPASVARAIPALVHADGRNGARFRSDLFLYNDSDSPKSVTLAAKPWDAPAAETTITLTLLAREGKIVRDVLAAAFGQTGVARMRFVSNGGPTAAGVRVTSRAYTELPGGGTYGVPLPPLNAFQMAGPGEAIELFGVLGGPAFRTNLALVDMTAFADGTSVRAHVEVLGDGGATLDAFDVNVPVAGGIQIDDLFRARHLGDGPQAALIRISPAGGLVGAYATSLDQGTNDAILVSAALVARD